jgi:hypothetical protein
MSTTTKQQVRLFIEQHDRDGLMYTDCPECGKANKLMVGTAEEGGHFYKCLSAACGTFGTTEGRAAGVPKEGTKVPEKGRELATPFHKEGDFVPMGVPTLKKLRGYGLSNKQVGILCRGRLGRSGRYVFPIYSPLLEVRGYVARIFDGTLPKSLTRPYRDLPVPLISWYFPQGNSQHLPVILVEDQISAARLGEYLPTVAMLGTTINYHDHMEIAATAQGLNSPRICAVLDNDACMDAVNLAKKFTNGVPIPLFHSDIKDMGADELSELVGVLHGR